MKPYAWCYTALLLSDSGPPPSANDGLQQSDRLFWWDLPSYAVNTVCQCWSAVRSTEHEMAARKTSFSLRHRLHCTDRCVRRLESCTTFRPHPSTRPYKVLSPCITIPTGPRKNIARTYIYINAHLMKKVLRETQRLRAGCSKAEPKNFAPRQAPSRGRMAAKI